MYISKIICRIRRQIARIAIATIESKGFGLSLWHKDDELVVDEEAGIMINEKSKIDEITV